MSRIATQLRPAIPPRLTPAVRTAYRHLVGRASRDRVESRMMREARRTVPRTYNEKMRYKMAFDRRPLLTLLADKVAVRDYVARRIGEDFLAAVYAVTDDPWALDWAAIPGEFVAKVNHASGGMVIVWEGADPAARLPENPRGMPWDRPQVHPDAVDHGALTRLLDYWLHQDYSWFPGKPVIEWAYEDVPHKVLVEELLTEDGRLPADLKFTMVHGEVIWIQVDCNRFGTHSKDIMSPDWERLPVTYNSVPVSATPPPRPRRLDDMLKAARRLGEGLDFIRADFYEIGDRIVFGEMTNYPACGRGRVDPPHFDDLWGRNWRIDYGGEPCPLT